MDGTDNAKDAMMMMMMMMRIVKENPESLADDADMIRHTRTGPRHARKTVSVANYPWLARLRSSNQICETWS
jgi:hypothetical protein